MTKYFLNWAFSDPEGEGYSSLIFVLSLLSFFVGLVTGLVTTSLLIGSLVFTAPFSIMIGLPVTVLALFDTLSFFGRGILKIKDKIKASKIKPLTKISSKIESYMLKDKVKKIDSKLVRLVCSEVATDQLDRGLEKDESIEVLDETFFEDGSVMAIFRYRRYRAVVKNGRQKDILDYSVHAVRLTANNVVPCIDIEKLVSCDQKDLRDIPDILKFVKETALQIGLPTSREFEIDRFMTPVKGSKTLEEILDLGERGGVKSGEVPEKCLES